MIQYSLEEKSFFSAKPLFIMNTEEENKRQHPLSKCSKCPYNILAKNGHQSSQNETNTKETTYAPKTNSFYDHSYPS